MLVRGKKNVVAEAPEVEYVRQIGQHFIAGEGCSRVHAAPGEIIRCGGREVWMQVRSEIGEAAPYASLVVGVHNSLTLLARGLVSHADVSLFSPVSGPSMPAIPGRCFWSRRCLDQRLISN